MREILFKSKRLDNGEWVQGCLIKHEFDGRVYIGYVFEDMQDGFVDTDLVQVDPETVCQYIGIVDKNGKMVFGGDIVRLRTGRDCKVVYKYNSEYCGFDLEPIAGFEYPAPKFSAYMDLEVIGNIHDKED